MAEVLSPHSTSNPPSPRGRVPSYASNRLSRYSMARSSSRPQSTAFPAFQSSLAYTSVRDFAYPAYHPLHYGPTPEAPSDATTPGSEAPTPLSDPQSDRLGGTGGWSAGLWGGDDVISGDPDNEGMEALPATSFGSDKDAQEDSSFGGAKGAQEDTSFTSAKGAQEDTSLGSAKGAQEDTSFASAKDAQEHTSFAAGQRGKHRKSKSYANIGDFERGRKRDSSGSNVRRNRVSQVIGASGDSDMFLFQGTQHFHPSNSSRPGGGTQLDPAGAESLRHSRGYQSATTRRDSRQLPPRAYHTSQPVQTPLDSDMPLDTEIPVSPAGMQRESMGPEDELFAGESLALYSFEPENPNELRLTEGQIILVSYRHGQGWLVAEDPRTGEQGLVPEEYVRLLADMEGWDAETGTFIEDATGEDNLLDGTDAQPMDIQQASATQLETAARATEGQSPDDLSEYFRSGTEPADPEMLHELIRNTDALEMVDSRKSTEARQDSAHAER